MTRPEREAQDEPAYQQAGLTPSILATVLAGLLLSSYATNWIGLHFIFGAFLFGVVMPREAVLGLRGEILVRLGHLRCHDLDVRPECHGG